MSEDYNVVVKFETDEDSLKAIVNAANEKISELIRSIDEDIITAVDTGVKEAKDIVAEDTEISDALSYAVQEKLKEAIQDFQAETLLRMELALEKSVDKLSRRITPTTQAVERLIEMIQAMPKEYQEARGVTRDLVTEDRVNLLEEIYKVQEASDELKKQIERIAEISNVFVDTTQESAEEPSSIQSVISDLESLADRLANLQVGVEDMQQRQVTLLQDGDVINKFVNSLSRDDNSVRESHLTDMGSKISIDNHSFTGGDESDFSFIEGNNQIINYLQSEDFGERIRDVISQPIINNETIIKGDKSINDVKQTSHTTIIENQQALNEVRDMIDSIKSSIDGLSSNMNDFKNTVRIALKKG